MRLVVDLIRCEGFGQCAVVAPDVFRMRGVEALWDNPEPDAVQRELVLRAAAACPVQAIPVDRIDARDAAAATVSGSAAAAARAKPAPLRPVPPPPADLWPHLATPLFWSQQFGTNIKSVGVPTLADQVVIAQRSVSERRFVAACRYRGRITAAVSFDQGIWLGFYREMIEAAEPVPPAFPAVGPPAGWRPAPAQIDHKQRPHATVSVAGHDPGERRAEFISPLALVLAAGNRDPGRFADPDRFDPGRIDNTHFGYGGVSTTALARRSPGRRRRWRCLNWPAGWSIPGSSPTRLRTGPTRNYAALATSSSNTTPWPRRNNKQARPCRPRQVDGAT